MKSFKELRQDPHRPSIMDPADYVFVGAADDHPGDSYLEIRHDTLARFGVETGSSDRYSSANVPFYDATEDGRPNYRCHHCGKHGSNIRYFVFFLHKPTKQVIVVGQICAKKLNMASREELDLQKRAAEFRRMRERHQWVEGHQDEYTFLKEYDERHTAGGWYSEFLSSLWEQLQERASLSDKQLAALRVNMERQRERQTQVDADRHKAVVTRTDEPPTEAQLTYIKKLSDELGKDTPTPIDTRQQASGIINRLKAEVLELRGQQPNGDAATERQISYINDLMDNRVIPTEKRQEARRRLDAGLTKAQASAWIEKLQELPEIGAS